VQAQPQRFELSKLWAKFLKIWAKMTPTVFRKATEDLFLEVTPKRGLRDLCGRKFVGEVAQ